MLTPILVVTISYVLGIIFGKFFQIPVIFPIIALLILIISVYISIQQRQKPVYLIIIGIFILGISAYQHSITIPPNDISSFAEDRYVKVVGSLADEPAYSGEYYRFTLKVDQIFVRESVYRSTGYCSVFVKEPKTKLNYGNKVSVYGKLSRIISTSNPGIASFGDIMAKKRINCQLFTYGAKVELLKNSIGNPLKYISIIIRNRLISVIQATMKEPYSSLLGSIVFGSQASPLSNELQDNYRTAGVIHLLVVSGTQVSIILSVVLSACKVLGLSQKWRLTVVSAANLLFTVMVGAGPSIIRAAVMAETALVAGAFERENDFYNSLSVSVLVLLILNPLNLFDIGFQLSFLATWALFYLAPVLEERLIKYMPGIIANTAAISIAPTLASTPVILYNFGQVSFISVVSNFLIIPWVEMTVILGFASTLLGLVFLPLAYAINNTLTLILAFLNLIVYSFSSFPLACRYFTPPVFPVILIYYGLLITGVEMLREKLKVKVGKAFAAALVLLVIMAAGFNLSFAAGKELVVTFIDVGQGDSILIESPSGKNMLIDGGGRNFREDRDDPTGRSIVVPLLRKKGINELDIVVLTHPHDDHVGGLPYVLDKVKVDMVIDSGQPHTSKGYYRFLKTIEKKNLPYKIARTGQIIDIGGGVKGYVLHPSEPLISGTESDLNNNSVVIRLVYGKTSFLLVGDAAFEAEDRFLGSGQNLKSDVLKVGHHGSKTSTSDKFLAEVRPAYAVISVGAKNKFGHPSNQTLGRLAEYGIKVFRTDLNGAIIIKSDGNMITPVTPNIR